MQNPQDGPMEVTRFLPWSMSRPEGETRELVGGTPPRTRAETNPHNFLKGAVAVRLQAAIDAVGSECRLYGDGATVVIDEHHGYTPDAAVQCGGPVDLDGPTVESPAIVVKVLSPSTASRDEGEKTARSRGEVAKVCLHRCHRDSSFPTTARVRSG